MTPVCDSRCVRACVAGRVRYNNKNICMAVPQTVCPPGSERLSERVCQALDRPGD